MLKSLRAFINLLLHFIDCRVKINKGDAVSIPNAKILPYCNLACRHFFMLAPTPVTPAQFQACQNAKA